MFFTLTIYHAHIDVQRIINATEKTVIKTDQPNAVGNPVLPIPVV